MALSSTQAEVLAATDAARNAEWLRALLIELNFTPEVADYPTTIFNDNSGAVILSQHPHDHGSTKHFGIRTGYLRHLPSALDNRLSTEALHPRLRERRLAPYGETIRRMNPEERSWYSAGEPAWRKNA
jgi:hypothetical protein